MIENFQIGTDSFTGAEVIGLLQRYQLMPQLLRGLVSDRAIAPYSLTEDERSQLIPQFYEQNKIENPEQRSQWLKANDLTEPQLLELLERPVLLEKFKQETFGHRVESYFMTRKPALDRVLYSLIRTKDQGVAQELYFRVKEGEQPFSEIARQYSQGAEANTGGLVGPAPLTMPHPAIAKALQVSQPGQVWPPTRLDDWFIILRLEKFYPAQLDATVRRQLVDELFEVWMREELQKIGSLRIAATAQ
jgi:parvulin-like peptidyl-prolyl isomerase